MAHKNPVVVSTDGKKHETLGNGNTLAPGSIPISAESGNGLSVKADGLFAEPGGGGGGGLTEVAHNNSLAGKGTTADPLRFTIIGSAGAADSDNILRVGAVQSGGHNLRVPHVADVLKETPSITAVVGDDGTGGRKTVMDVRLSGRSGNALQILDFGADGGAGLFAGKMTRGAGGGNWSFGYPDSPGAKNACGKIGSGIYFKSTIEMSNANVGDVNVKVDVWLKNLPCMEDGTLVSHRVLVDYVSATTSARPTAAIWLICDTPPTHMINIESKTITKLQRSPESLTTGLPDYPTAPDGEYAQEFTYSRQYFYTP